MATFLPPGFRYTTSWESTAWAKATRQRDWPDDAKCFLLDGCIRATKERIDWL